MRGLAMAAVGAAMVIALGASSAAQAALINFSAATFGGTVLYTGSSLDQSTALDLDDAFLVVGQPGPGDQSGLQQFDLITVKPTNIQYGAGAGPGTLPNDGVVKSWTGSNGDEFVETLTTVDSINRLTPDAITVSLSGTVSDTFKLFVNTPISLLLGANQVGGPGDAVTVMLTEATSVTTPEIPTWAMLALGFAALGYAASRWPKAKVAMPSA